MKTRHHDRRPQTTVLGLVALVLAGCDDSAPVTEVWLPLSAGEVYAEKGLEQWAIGWARWSFSQTSCVPAFSLDRDGSSCELYQDPQSPVFFLAAGPPTTVRKRCKVPGDKALVVPLMTYSTDNAGRPEAEIKSEPELEAEAAAVKATMSGLRLVVDGREIRDLDGRGVGPTKFSYEVPPAPNWYSCLHRLDFTGSVEPAFITGYFVVLPPAPEGAHVLEYAGILHVDRQPVPNHVELAFEID